MKKFRINLLLLILIPVALHGQNTVTFWYGWYPQLDEQPISMSFKINKGKDFTKAWMTSLDNGKLDIPVEIHSSMEDSIVLVLDSTLRFTGTVSDTIFAGYFTTAKNPKIPATFYHRPYYAAWPGRTQTPEFPPSYRMRDVSIPTPNPEVHLAGTLTLPDGKGPFPGVVLLHGDGMADRDYTGFGHQPFLVLADQLTKRGIAVLRYDKRGCLESTGSFAKSVIADFANDGYAALQFLREQPEVAAEMSGVIGHSKGATLACVMASQHREIPFIILMAGEIQEFRKDFVDYSQGFYRAMGASKDQMENVRKIDSTTVALILQIRDTTKLRGSLYKHINKNYKEYPFLDHALTGADREKAIQGELYELMRPETINEIRDFNQKEIVTSISCPVLYMVGDKDLNVSATLNPRLLTSYLQEGGNHELTIKIFPGLNHGFQTATTGLYTEYPKNPETFYPEVFEVISDWVWKQVR